ncbi:MAG: protein kinase domain-containing protein, partial [Bryobacteraceae bacterium]
MTGTWLGPYHILSRLGSGGMGEVYRARDPRLGRDVAIKILSADSIGSAERQHRFEQEAKAASALNHPNIITVHDVGTENGKPYIVTELIDGDSLRRRIPSDGLSPRALLDLAVQIADGLACAHQAAIVHRDLKPENIMVTRDGRVKILDFGLAKTIAPLSSVETVSQPGMVVGTAHYMSPEQARGDEPDHRSDQFSFGLVLYEMAAGRRPFPRKTAVETLTAIINEEAPPLPERHPAPLRWIVERTLSKDRAQRYDSTGDLYRALRDMRDHLAEMRTFPAEPPPSPLLKRRAVVASLAAALAVAAGVAAGALLFRAETTGIATYRFTPVATEAGLETHPAWSPDGKTVAYA